MERFLCITIFGTCSHRAVSTPHCRKHNDNTPNQCQNLIQIAQGPVRSRYHMNCSCCMLGEFFVSNIVSATMTPPLLLVRTKLRLARSFVNTDTHALRPQSSVLRVLLLLGWSDRIIDGSRVAQEITQCLLKQFLLQIPCRSLYPDGPDYHSKPET